MSLSFRFARRASPRWWTGVPHPAPARPLDRTRVPEAEREVHVDSCSGGKVETMPAPEIADRAEDPPIDRTPVPEPAPRAAPDEAEVDEPAEVFSAAPPDPSPMEECF